MLRIAFISVIVFITFSTPCLSETFQSTGTIDACSSPREGATEAIAKDINLSTSKEFRMPLPNTIPENDPASLWALQNELIAQAEGLIGKRDQTKKIYQPSFHINGPHICNTPSFDGAFVELGQGSKVYWPTVVYEMSHETIHLLNPVAGPTNWLEEGVAVDFSIYAQKVYGLAIQEPKSGPYFEALQMVRSLPDGTFAAAKRIRVVSGSLSTITFKQLQELFPKSKPTLLQRLSEECIPR